MAKFHPGQEIVVDDLTGTFCGYIDDVPGYPDTVSVDLWIPSGHPDFEYTGIWENFWLPESTVKPAQMPEKKSADN